MIYSRRAFVTACPTQHSIRCMLLSISVMKYPLTPPVNFCREMRTKSLTNSFLAKKGRNWTSCNVTTATLSFLCMAATIQHCKSVKSMVFTVTHLSRYNCNIDIYHSIYPLFQKGPNQFVSHSKARWDKQLIEG